MPYAGIKLPRMTCPKCGNSVAYRMAGKLRSISRHALGVRRRGLRQKFCPASGTDPSQWSTEHNG